MDSVSIHQLLTIVTWFALSVLLFLMALIARFYERLSGKRTYYQLFVVPLLAFTGSTIRMTRADQVVGDAWADGLLLVGGLALTTLCVHVYRRMTGRQ